MVTKATHAPDYVSIQIQFSPNEKLFARGCCMLFKLLLVDLDSAQVGGHFQ